MVHSDECRECRLTLFGIKRTYHGKVSRLGYAVPKSRCIYTTECLLTADTVMLLLYAAKKYGIVSLVNKSKEYLKSEISTENVCVILKQAHMYDEQDLIAQCLSFICKAGRTVLKSAGFLCLSKDTLRMILESDTLDIPEDEVYASCVKWAEEECQRLEKSVNYTNSREALGELVYLIRFPCMTLYTFTSLIADGAILTLEESMSIVLQLTQKKPSKFNNKPRMNCEHLEDALIERCSGVLTNWKQSGLTDAISFTCNQNLKLAGVSLYTPCTPGKVRGKLECHENDRCVISMNIELAYERSITSVKILFDTHVDIRKTSTYTLTQTVKGANTCYGTAGQECVKKDNIELRFVRSERSANNTSVEQGQFHGLIFL